MNDLNNKDSEDNKNLVNDTASDKFVSAINKGAKKVANFFSGRGRKAGRNVAKKIVHGLIKIIGNLLKLGSFIIAHIIPISLCLLAIFVGVALFNLFVGINTDDEYETKFTAANYQEDSVNGNNKLQLNKHGVWGFNRNADKSIKQMSKSNKLYYTYYAYNAQNSYYLAQSAYNNVSHKWVNSNKSIVSGASDKGERVKKALSDSVGGLDVSKAIIELSMSPEMLYLFDNAVNKSLHGAGKQGFYFPEQFTRPVSYNSDDLSYEPITKQRKLTSEEKADYQRMEDTYQERFHPKTDSSYGADPRQPSFANDYETSKDTNKGDPSHSDVDVSKDLVNKDTKGKGVPNYLQESLSTDQLKVKSTDMNMNYVPDDLNKNITGKIGKLPKNKGALVYNSDGSLHKVYGVWDYGFGTIFRLGKIHNDVYDRIETTTTKEVSTEKLSTKRHNVDKKVENETILNNTKIGLTNKITSDSSSDPNIAKTAEKYIGWFNYNQVHSLNTFKDWDNPPKNAETDCAGFVWFILHKVGNYSLPEDMQWYTKIMEIDATKSHQWLKKIKPDDAGAGDIVIANTGNGSGNNGHVAILAEQWHSGTHYLKAKEKVIQHGGNPNHVNESSFSTAFSKLLKTGDCTITFARPVVGGNNTTSSSAENWRYNPNKSKDQMLLIGITSPFGYIDLSEIVRDQYEANKIKAKYDLEHIDQINDGLVKGKHMSEFGRFLPIKDEDGKEMYISIPKSTFTPTEKDFSKGNDKFQSLPKYSQFNEAQSIEDDLALNRFSKSKMLLKQPYRKNNDEVYADEVPAGKYNLKNFDDNLQSDSREISRTSSTVQKTDRNGYPIKETTTIIISEKVVDERQTIPTFDYSDFPDKSIHMIGLQYFTDYLRYLKMYVPDYVSTNMNVEQRLQEIDKKAKDKNSKEIWKEINKILNDNSIRQTIVNQGAGKLPSSGKTHKKAGDKTGGVAFLGEDNGNFMRAMKYWNLINKYSAIYGVDPYVIVALACHESGGNPGIDQEGGGPGWGFLQFEFNGDGFGNTRTLNGFLANGTPTSTSLTKGDDVGKQIIAGCCFISGARIFKNVGSQINYHHIPALAQKMDNQLKSNSTLEDAIKTGIDSDNLKGVLAYYGGVNPWIMDRKGIKHYGNGTSGSSEGGTVFDEGSTSVNIFNKAFGWIGDIVSKLKDVETDLFGTKKGVNIWSEENANNYSWKLIDGRQSNTIIHDLATNYLALLLSNASPNLDYYYSTVQDNNYVIGRRIDDFYYNVMKTVFTGSSSDQDDNGRSGHYGSPLKEVPNVNNLQVNSSMGWRNLGGMQWHQGYDLQSGTQPIVAVDDGIIAKTGYADGHGNYVILKTNGTYVYYQHLSKYSCHVGQKVNKGQELGITGGTGGNFAVHLHFGEFKNGSKWTKNSYPFPPARDTAGNGILAGEGNGNAADNDYISPGLSWGLSQKQEEYLQERVNGYKGGVGHYKKISGSYSSMTIGEAKKH